jgi:hypothetical protein
MDTIILAITPILLSVIGYLVHRTVSDIDDSIKEVKKSQYVMSERQREMEVEQKTQSHKIDTLQKTVTHTHAISQTTKTTLDHNLYEMRQELKTVKDEQFEVRKNWGKIIFIMQKLHASIKKDTTDPKD